MGKHFSFTSKSQNKTRLYSLCLAGNENIHKKHKQLIDNIYLLESSKEIINASLYEDEMNSPDLQVYIKWYSIHGALSDYLHSKDIPDDDLTVKGPLGLGLDLPEEEVEGTYVAFSAGTGIYCFFDFIAYVIRYTVNKVSVEHFECSKNKLHEEETFKEVRKLKLILFCSFPDEKSAYWHDLFLKAKDISHKYQLDIFEYYPRISNQEKRPTYRDW